MTNQFDAIDGIRAISGPLFVILCGMILLLWDLGSKASGRRRSALPVIAILGLAIGAILALASTSTDGTALTGGTEPKTYFGGGMVSDTFGALLCVILSIVAGLAVLMSERYLTEKGINQGEFYALLLFSTSGAMLMALSFDLVNVFVGLEILSVSLYILSGFARRERRSEEAAVKYFLLGAFATGFLLFGTSLVYGSVGLAVQNQVWAPSAAAHSYTNFYVIGQALLATQAYAPSLMSSPIFVAGVGLIFVGLGFKAAIVPFHSYAPDVYEGAPTPVTAFMSVAAKIGAFGALIRLVLALSTGGAGIGPFHPVLWGLAAATMIVGNVLAVRQVNIKRMLAYSSIAHAGYILVGVLATTSSNLEASKLAQSAIHFYLFAYAFMNLGAFALVIWLGRAGHGEYLSIREYYGLGKRNPLAAAVMSVIMLSLAGIPPTAGFVGKLYLFKSAIDAGEGMLAVIGLVVSAIGVFYYLNLIAAMYFREPHPDTEKPRAGEARIAAVLCAFAILLFGVVPALSGPFAPKMASGGSATPRARGRGGRGGRGGGRRRGGRRPRASAPGAPADTVMPVPSAEATSASPAASATGTAPAASQSAEESSVAPLALPSAVPSVIPPAASSAPATPAVPAASPAPPVSRP